MRHSLLFRLTGPVTWLAVFAAAAWLAWTAAADVRTTGYVLDEELTTLAVRGIARDGLPTLPSGALYERGLPYSYVAAVTGRVLGEELPAFRLASLVLGALASVGMFVGVRAALRDATAGITASWLIALYPAMVAAAAWARFYTLATVAIAAALAAFFLWRRRVPVLFPIAAALASLVHEISGLLIVLPMADAAMTSDLESRRAAQRTAILTFVALGAARLVLLALHFAVPNQMANPWLTQPPVSPSWFALPGRQLLDVAGPAALVALAVAQALFAWWMARRERLTVTLLLPSAALATLFQLGMTVWWTLAILLIVPARTRGLIRHAIGAMVGAIATWWTVFAVHHIAPLDVDGWSAFVALGFVVPADSLRIVTDHMPFTVALVLMSGVLAARDRSPASLPVRMVLCLLMTTVAAFSFLDVTLAPRHLLLMVPGLTFVMAALPLLIESTLQRRLFPTPPVWRAAVTVLVLIVVVGDWRQRRAAGSREERIEVLDQPSIRAAAAAAVIITNDDLASVFELGRTDYWYVESPSDREKYALQAASGPIGVYSGGAILDTPDALHDRMTACAAHGGCLLAVFRTGRFPFSGFEQLSRGFAGAMGGVELRRTRSMTLTHIPARERPSS